MSKALMRFKQRLLYRRIKKMGRALRKWNRFKRLWYSTYPRGKTDNVFMMGREGGAKFKDLTDVQKAARRAFNFYGEGDYKDWLKYASRGIGGLAGGALGYMNRGFGGLSGGAEEGWNKGADFSRWMGWGDYTTNQIAGGTGSQISVNRTDATGDIWVTRTEFVQNVVASHTGAGASAFQITSFPLNPGMSSVFPWLSQIAQNFTMYEFHGLMFQFKPTFSDNAGTSSNLGKVIMATDYDPNAQQFLTSVQMENYDYANACKPSDGLIHGVETKNSQQYGNMQYVRTGNTSRDKIFTDIGLFQLATEGIPFSAAGSQIIGELWVTYSVKLSRAELYNSLLGLAIGYDEISGLTTATDMVSTAVYSSDNTIGCTVTNINATTGQITFPTNISLGYYQIVIVHSSGGTVFTTQQPNPFTAITNCQMWRPGVTGGYYTPTLPQSANTQFTGPATPVGTTSNTQLINIGYIVINAPGLAQASIRYHTSAALTNTSGYIILITQMNRNMAQ